MRRDSRKLSEASRPPRRKRTNNGRPERYTSATLRSISPREKSSVKRQLLRGTRPATRISSREPRLCDALRIRESCTKMQVARAGCAWHSGYGCQVVGCGNNRRGSRPAALLNRRGVYAIDCTNHRLCHPARANVEQPRSACANANCSNPTCQKDLRVGRLPA